MFYEGELCQHICISFKQLLFGILISISLPSSFIQSYFNTVYIFKVTRQWCSLVRLWIIVLCCQRMSEWMNHPQHVSVMLILIYPHQYVVKASTFYELCKVTSIYIYTPTASKIFKSHKTFISCCPNYLIYF